MNYLAHQNLSRVSQLKQALFPYLQSLFVVLFLRLRKDWTDAWCRPSPTCKRWCQHHTLRLILLWFLFESAKKEREFLIHCMIGSRIWAQRGAIDRGMLNNLINTHRCMSDGNWSRGRVGRACGAWRIGLKLNFEWMFCLVSYYYRDV